MQHILYLKREFFGRAVTPLTLRTHWYEHACTVDGLDREEAFRAMNAVDGDPDTEVCVRSRVRSMSVGDVLIEVLHEEECHVWVCMPFGWEELRSQERSLAFGRLVALVPAEPKVEGIKKD